MKSVHKTSTAEADQDTLGWLWAGIHVPPHLCLTLMRSDRAVVEDMESIGLSCCLQQTLVKGNLNVLNVNMENSTVVA